MEVALTGGRKSDAPIATRAERKVTVSLITKHGDDARQEWDFGGRRKGPHRQDNDWCYYISRAFREALLLAQNSPCRRLQQEICEPDRPWVCRVSIWAIKRAQAR